MDVVADNNFSTVDIVREILKSRKNANLILKLEDRFLSEDDNVVLSSIEAVQEIFLHFIENEDICSDVVPQGLNAEEKYKIWLKERFDDFKSHMLSLMHHRNREIQEAALDALMKFLKAEGENYKTKSEIHHFPRESLGAIVCSLMNGDVNMLQVINHFKQFLTHDDLKLYVLKSVLIMLKSNKMQETPLSLQNTFALLSAVHFPTKFGSDEGECYTNAFIHSPGAAPFVLKRNVFSRMFTLAWVQFLKCKLPAAVYKKILIFLPKKVLPHLNDPLVLTDFLTDSYNVGGIVSLLALNGIFYLIQNFNLEYPEFFNKLYGMFTYEILMSKFQARFFFLSDLFLSST